MPQPQTKRIKLLNDYKAFDITGFQTNKVFKAGQIYLVFVGSRPGGIPSAAPIPTEYMINNALGDNNKYSLPRLGTYFVEQADGSWLITQPVGPQVTGGAKGTTSGPVPVTPILPVAETEFNKNLPINGTRPAEKTNNYIKIAIIIFIAYFLYKTFA